VKARRSLFHCRILCKLTPERLCTALGNSGFD
jgi:hypothetical protein